MAEVLQVPRSPTRTSLYEPGGLRRSHSASGQLYLGAAALPSSYHSDAHAAPAEHQEYAHDSPISLSSNHYSTPNFSTDFPSLQRTQSGSDAGSTSLEDRFATPDDINFPDYGGVQFFHQNESYADSQSSEDPVESTTTDTTASDSPLPTPTIADDTALKQEPKQHVDYLSHDWREEDIWSSWRHIVSQRKVYGQRSRLENASWRTWAKSKYSLRTVSPETLNWLKESDVTWLYGPLKPAESHPITANRSAPISQLSKTNSFLNKKPILKKRSMSEVMLQRSISTSSLLKQAAASVEAQQSKHPSQAGWHQHQSDFTPSAFTSETPSRDQIDYFTSRDGSDNSTPCECHPRRHIRFDDKVEQCIAVECKDDHEEEGDSDEEFLHRVSSESSSDDGVIMMKRKKTSRDKGTRSSRSGSQTRKMIETLPASTLKYRTDSPDLGEAQQHHTFGHDWSANRLSPSPSQETLRPSRPSANFLVPEEDETAAPDPESSTWSFGASNPKSSLGSASSSDEEVTTRSRRRTKMTPASARSSTPAPSEYNSESLRRTNSGMLMPYDEDEDDAMAIGLFGKVSETINTARDIAHVIWNVGWRK